MILTGGICNRFSMDSDVLEEFLTTWSAPQSPTSDEPPPYVRRNTLPHPITPREPIEHVYSLKDSNKVRLKLYSRAKSPESLPVYFEREKISGLLEINAERGDSIHSITAKVSFSA
jgi:hypothetical protein